MRVKRWIVLSAAGIFLVVSGTVRVVSELQSGIVPLMGTVFLTTGIVLLISGVKRMVKSFITVFTPAYEEKELVDIIYRKRQLSRGPKIVAVGGGTGLSVLLSGLKEFTSNITAIVTVTDDGGSSGRLRQQFDVLPPGDIRNCLVALADAEPLMRDLFQFRFEAGTELGGHNFGNLFITAMSKIAGDFEKGIRESSKVLAIRGRVLPSTLRRVTLAAEHEDGSRSEGETNISSSTSPIKRVFLKPENCAPTEDALSAISEADAVILGPGSLYTSILPNLLINGVAEAIIKSSAIKVYACNVMTQHGETDNYTAFDHCQAIISHSGKGIIDYCVVNTEPVPDIFLKKYRVENAFPVKTDVDRFKEAGITVIADDVLCAQDHVRHDPGKLAKTVVCLLLELRNRSAFSA